MEIQGSQNMGIGGQKLWEKNFLSDIQEVERDRGQSRVQGGYIYRQEQSRRSYMVDIIYLRVINSCYFDQCLPVIRFSVSTNAVFMRFFFNQSLNAYFANSCFAGLLLLYAVQDRRPVVFYNMMICSGFFSWRVVLYDMTLLSLHFLPVFRSCFAAGLLYNDIVL